MQKSYRGQQQIATNNGGDLLLLRLPDFLWFLSLKTDAGNAAVVVAIDLPVLPPEGISPFISNELLALIESPITSRRSGGGPDKKSDAEISN